MRRSSAESRPENGGLIWSGPDAWPAEKSQKRLARLTQKTWSIVGMSALCDIFYPTRMDKTDLWLYKRLAPSLSVSAEEVLDTRPFDL